MEVSTLAEQQAQHGSAVPSPVGQIQSGSARPSIYVLLRQKLELVAALTLLLVCVPFLVLVALLIRLTSRGPAIYKQVRVGHRGRLFTLYKLRTMTEDSEKSGPQWSSPGDLRITPLGRFLRRAHIDELPQLWNVVRGEMSFLGPRPERPEMVGPIAEQLPTYLDRLAVLPGITGLAQVTFPGDTTIADVERKLQYDLYYSDRCGPWLDVRILVATVLKAVGFSFSWLARLCRFPREQEVRTYNQAVGISPRADDLSPLARPVTSPTRGSERGDTPTERVGSSSETVLASQSG